LLSKDARRSIINVMLYKRSLKEVSDILGVTPASISKYKSGLMHPSDDTLRRALDVLDGEELRIVARIIFNDLYSGLQEFIAWTSSNTLIENEMIEKLEKLANKISSLAPKRTKIIVQ